MPPIVDVTLLSLAGVSITLLPKAGTRNNNGNYNNSRNNSPSRGGTSIIEAAAAAAAVRIPKMTASVAFSGSAANMQVASSLISTRTGNLMVESNEAIAAPSIRSTCATASTIQQQHQYPCFQPLVAEWKNNFASDSSDCAENDEQPHVSIQLPPQNPRLPAMSVSRTNRDSKIIIQTSTTATTTSSSHEQQPSLNASDVSSHTSSFDEQRHNHDPATDALAATDDDDDDDENGAASASVFWSQSGAGGAVMPEIIELTVFLKVDPESLKPKDWDHRPHGSPNRILVGGSVIKETPSLLDSSESWDEMEDLHSESIYEVGVAYLVLFGNDGGTTIMDLPIKQIQNNFPDTIHVDPTSASLRIRVNVYPTGKKSPRRCSRNPASAMGLLRQAYQLHDTNILEPILRHLKVTEETNTKVLLGGKGTTDKVVAAAATTVGQDVPTAPATILCGLSNMMDFLKSVRCDDGADGIVPKSDDSMSSTINTAPSLRFW